MDTQEQLIEIKDSTQKSLDIFSESNMLSTRKWQSIRQKIGRIGLSLSLSLGGGSLAATVSETLQSNSHPAFAETGGYPDADAIDCSSKYGIYSWCKDDGWLSSRGFGYRNCTDWAAYREQQLTGVSVPYGSRMGDAKDWDDNAPAYRFSVDNTPEPGDIAVWEASSSNSFGHVAPVESVNTNGTVNISEYNHGGDGNYDTRNGVTADHYIDFNGTGKGINGMPIGGTQTSPTSKKADIVVHDGNNNWAVATSTGNSLVGNGIGLSGWGKGDWTGLADVNGDGKADIVVHNPANASFAVALNNGNGQFYSAGNWLTGWGAGDWVGLADVNHDQKADLVVHDPSNNAFAVALSSGTSFNGTGYWLWGWGKGDWIGMADVDGDGNADIVVHNPANNSFAVATSDAHLFTGRGNWLTGWGAGDWASLGDVNGDGKSDLVVHSPVNNAWAVAISNGSSLVGSGNGLSFWGKGDWAGLSDVTGDGKADIIVHNPDNASFDVAINNGNNQFYGSGHWLTGWGAGDWVGNANVNGD